MQDKASGVTRPQPQSAFSALLKPGFEDHRDREVLRSMPLLLAGGQLDWHVLRGADRARAGVLMGVASKCLEQKNKLLGKHGSSPGRAASPIVIDSCTPHDIGRL